MDCRQLDLDCDQQNDGDWRVFCRNSGEVLSENHRDSETAWMKAAELLADCVSSIRRTVANVE